ncbi:histidine phosphatase family protein [Actinopolymorpha alba]|uniref:histidine phosphatase family protein n=1 Tax=Actinopolymorpha alba TaxID=533267 RepID=UPI00035ED86C|nr:histidine phosphatase family protein [Actinopolymorpha alba]
MGETRPQLWIARHGETEWSRSGRHTSVTDLSLTEDGERAALALGDRLAGTPFDLVLTSPLRRARETARLAGFGDRAQVEPAAHEWRYGDYEGLTTAQIRERVPGWSLWTDPVPGGEKAAEVAARADLIIERVRRDVRSRALLFAHGHILRVLAARWIGKPPRDGAFLALDVATVSVLGWERETPALRKWNA